jgi:hypothetical protein
VTQQLLQRLPDLRLFDCDEPARANSVLRVDGAKLETWFASRLLGRPFLAALVQPDSEYQELLWALDHTARLADAQLRLADKARPERP